MANYLYKDGQIVLSKQDEKEITSLLRQAVSQRDLAEMRAFANLIVEPISTVAAYEGWSDKVFSSKQVQPNEDWKIPLEQYNIMAYFSSPEGRVRRTRRGVTYVRPDFTTIKSGFEMNWDELEIIQWNVLSRMMQQTGQEIARKRDQLAFNVVNTAADSVGHVVNTTGGLMTRASTEYIFKASAAIGFPVKRVIANHATLMDMRASSFFTWASGYPLAQMSNSVADEIMKNGYVGDYGGAQWFGTTGLTSGTTLGPTGAVATGQAVVIYVGAPEENGWDVQRGQTRQMSDIDIDLSINKYMFSESRFFYAANPFRYWIQIITLS